MKDKKIIAIIAVILGFVLGLGFVTFVLSKVLGNDNT